jgi:2-dehydro-3-deoxyphosphogluconate aldolase/(4S)-4-hydroxy-2-oxoglutarate aldolase
MGTPTTTDPVAALFEHVRIVPVVVLDRVQDAAPLAQALLAGGLPMAEVTFRTAAAEESIRMMSERPELTVGAGTVLTADQVQQAVDAGAQFVVSPGFSASVVAACRERNVPVISGVATATEIQMALDSGQNVVKLFPAEAVGGLATLKALAAPFPSLRFVPTGGITEETASAYLAHPAVLAVGGSWMVATSLLAAGDFEEVRRRSERAVALLREPAQSGASR